MKSKIEFSKRDFTGKHVIVAGTGISGIGAVKLLDKCNADITLYDGNEALKEEDIREKIKDISNVKIVIGELKDEVINDNELMILSPGIPIDAPFVNKVRDMGLEIWGEIELAYANSKGRLVAITGTNGKTTTTSLVGEIMKNTYKDVYVVGNIGMSYADIAFDTTEDTVTVAEISSFQLETIKNFHPEVCAVLNITPDHLNRHYTMENYANVKMSIGQNQNADEICVLNYDDEILKNKKTSGKIIYYSSKSQLKQGVYLDNDEIVMRLDGKNEVVCNIHDMQLVGIHNVENVMAAVAISYYMGSSIDIIRDTIKTFKAVEHRIEYVTEKDGVIYYNDSKGTNTDASIKAIEAMSRPTILIAGGYDKGCEFDEWIDKFGDKIKFLVLLGKTKDKIAQTAREHGYNDFVMVDSLLEAVNVSKANAKSGDAVLLSPACASWDMFKSYEERGKLFKEYVNQL